MKKKIVLLLLAGFCILLSGCISVGPDYEQPVAELPDQWHAAVQAEFKSGTPTKERASDCRQGGRCTSEAREQGMAQIRFG